MIESAQGSLTIVDINLPTVTYYWLGKKIEHVQSAMANSKPPNRTHLALWVTDPDHVAPALTPEQKAELNSMYDAMEASGIDITRAKR
jgi:hypothetical protein